MASDRATVVIGGGMTGLLVARELLAAGQSVTVIERGRRDLGRDALPTDQREERLSTTVHNTESVPQRGGQRWQYAYALGGSTLLWAGVAPRLLPSDFEMRSRYGIWRDWPISYSELVPFYQRAERLMGVSGRPNPVFPDSDAYAVDPPPPSSSDLLLGPFLQPFGTLPLARTRYGWGNPDGDDRQWSALALARELADAEGFELVDGTAAARLRVRDGSVSGVECIAIDGGRAEIATGRVVLAANGIENSALLLRSGLDHGPVGRWLGDHTHISLELELAEPVEHRADTRDSGASYAWIDGPWRAERAAAVAIPYNHGLALRTHLARALAAGESGPDLRRRLAARFGRTVVIYLSLEDAPREDRFVTLSGRRDELGLPLSQVHYPGDDSDYVRRGLEVISRDLEERLRPLGARIVGQSGGGLGGHMLGTCFMGDGGVVDENLCHHRIGNLYVAGGSAFPTNSPMHPTMTIAALALRLGGHLAATAA